MESLLKERRIIVSDKPVLDPWNVLMGLVGHPSSASTSAVQLYWDRGTPFVLVKQDKQGWTRIYSVEHGSFEAVMLKIHLEQKQNDLSDPELSNG